MTMLWIAALLIVLIAGGLPVAFALGVAGSAGLYLLGGLNFVVGFLHTTPLSTVSTYELVTIPMFILMAEFLVVSGVVSDLFRAATIWMGRIKGGLAVSTVFTGAVLGATTGSSTASAATLAATTAMAMIREGYEPRLVYGLVAITGTLAMLIPPSIAIIIYGILAEVSIAKLLIAGIIPGAIVSLAIIITVYVLILRNPSLAPVSQAYRWGEKLRQLTVAGPFVALFAVVTGLMYLGICTPTEAASLGAFSAMVLTAMRGRLSVGSTLHALGRAARTTSMIALIIVGTHLFGYFLTLTQTTQSIVTGVTSLGLPPIVVLGFIVVLYILLGMFMDQIAILILTVPILLPVVVGLGYDPIWFGILVIIVAEVGMVSPPIGLNVFVVARYTSAPIGDVFIGVFPHILAHFILIVLFIAFPELILWLPSTMR